jgi:hypothetical protein
MESAHRADSGAEVDVPMKPRYPAPMVAGSASAAEGGESAASSRLPRWKRYLHQLIAAEISSFTRYYDRVVQCGRVPGDTGFLLGTIDCREKLYVEDVQSLPDFSRETDKRTAILLSATVNHNLDIQALLVDLRGRMSRSSRVVIVAFNAYLQWLYGLALRLGLKSGVRPTTFITWTDLDNICKISGMERVRGRSTVYFPWKFFGLGALINRIMPAVPVLRHLALTSVIVVRPVMAEKGTASVSVVIPARNERGNIEAALERMPDLGGPVEVIFVEGHSTDGTWEEILRVKEKFGSRFRIAAFQQTGKGKADAVRLGFANASGDLLTILDADLTMPPELLPRFINAWREGRADFINGSRIVYPMEGEAMRFLNRLGNVFFAKALTWVLDTKIGDSLCGTKLVTRPDYARMQAWRRDFGDFDPFGDFELLFPAAVLGLGVVDIPIRYRARTYGSTNISRFRHGVQLLRMTLVGLFRIKMARLP